VSNNTVATLSVEERDQLVAEYRNLGGKGWGFARKWKDATLIAKVESLRVLSQPTEEQTEVVVAPPEPEAPQEVPPMPTAEEQPPPEPDRQDPDVIEYLVAKGVHHTLKSGDRAPMCVGLGMIPSSWEDHGHLITVQDREVHWLSMTFLPKGFIRLPYNDDTWYMSVRATSFRYGIPQIGPGGVTESYLLGTDPTVNGEGVTLVGGIPVTDRRMLRAAIGTLWGMLSTGFRCRRKWQEKREQFVNFVSDPDGAAFGPRRKLRAWQAKFREDNGREPTPEETLGRMFFYGGEQSHPEEVIHTKSWMPVPLLAFSNTMRNTLFDRCTLQQLSNGEEHRSMPYALLNRFLLDYSQHGCIPVSVPFAGLFLGVTQGRSGGEPCCFLDFDLGQDGLKEMRRLRVSPHVEIGIEAGAQVCCGQIIGREEPRVYGSTEAVKLPPGFAKMKAPEQAKFLRRQVSPPVLDAYIRDWFSRQLYELRKNFIHVSGVLAHYAARFSSPGKLMWDITHCLPFWEEDVGGLLFPTLNEKGIVVWKDDDKKMHGAHQYVVRDDLHELVMDLTVQDPRLQEVPTKWWASNKSDSNKLCKQLDREKEELLADLKDHDLEMADMERMESAERAELLARARERVRLRQEEERRRREEEGV
jgi:hypothetical protein